MKGLRLLAIFLTSVNFANAKYEGWQVWRVVPANDSHRKWLREMESNLGDVLDFWSSISKIPGEAVDIMVPPRFQGTLPDVMKNMGLPYKVTISDVGELIANQMSAINGRRDLESRISSLADFDYNVYHPYDEIQQWVSDIAAEYSDIISPFLLDYSYEGRAINGFRIRGTGSQSENPTAVWFEGGIHAREWISPATVMGFTQKLLDDYRSGDALATNMLDNIDWYIVPSLNVDGYSYTWGPDRLWRKTRSPNQGSSCTGKDPNRNWAFEWGGPGTSPWPCSDKFLGPNPLSEPEVAAVTRFLRERKSQGQDFIVFIDWHSYSQKIIAPWSYKSVGTRTEDYDDQMAFAKAVADAINGVHGTVFTYGAGAEIMYAAAGSSKDFGYADFVAMGEDTKGGLGCKYSYTIELRDTGEYGQLLPEWQIQPVYEEIYAAVRAMGDHILRELGFIA